MTADPTPDPRARMLAEAETIRDDYAAALASARTERDNLRTELDRITAELRDRIGATGVTISGLVQQWGEADALVRSLTPRKARTSTGTGLPVATPDPGLPDPAEDNG